jgi:GNAT superfamily N-acetyltransferase
VRIRSADIADAPQMARLSTLLGYPSSALEVQSRLSKLASLSSHAVLVADSGSMLCGWASAELRVSLETDPRVEITGLVVDLAMRRQGIGRLLVAHVERWALAQNCSILMLRSNVTRPESHPFYERLEYERTKTQHSYKKVLNAV